MKVKCSLCKICEKGFCNHTAKRKKGKPVKITANKRRNCPHFNLNEEEATRILSKPKPKTTMRPDYFWMDRSHRKKLIKEYNKEIENTYISQYSSTAGKDTTKIIESKEVNDDERLF